MQEPVAQCFRLAGPQGLGEGEETQPGGQVRGEGDDLQPGLVDGELPGREPAEAGVLGVPDPVLHPGVGAVPGSSFFREPVNHLIRLHFAKKDETLTDALNRLESLREKIPAKG